MVVETFFGATMWHSLLLRFFVPTHENVKGEKVPRRHNRTHFDLVVHTGMVE